MIQQFLFHQINVAKGGISFICSYLPTSALKINEPYLFCYKYLPGSSIQASIESIGSPITRSIQILIYLLSGPVRFGHLLFKYSLWSTEIISLSWNVYVFGMQNKFFRIHLQINMYLTFWVKLNEFQIIVPFPFLLYKLGFNFYE